MKKFLSLFIVMMLICSTVMANATLPDAITKVYNNYAADYSISFSFESCDEVVALLEEMEMPAEINNFVDLKALIKSVLTYDAKMNVQVDISEDFKKIEMALTADCAQPVDVNKNLSLDIKSKVGMWMRLDISATQPVFEIIYSAPAFNRYMHMDMIEMMDYEGSGDEFLEALNSLFDKEYMENVTEYSKELIKKYATIKVSGKSCVIKFDNEGFTAMIDDAIRYAYDLSAEEMEVVMNPRYGEVSVPYEELPVFSGMQILGDNGITFEYTTVFGNITSITADSDIELNIADIYSSTTGEEWIYESEGILKFSMHEYAEMKNIGKTKVVFPELTEENSFSVMTMIYGENDGHGEDYEEYVQEYPYYYVGGYADNLPVIDGEIYVPLRSVMEGAYDDTVDISYNNGVVTMTSEYFGKIVLTIGSDKAYIGGAVKDIDKVVKLENTTYVSKAFFEDVFGWVLTSATYRMLEKNYYYSFYTKIY